MKIALLNNFSDQVTDRLCEEGYEVLPEEELPNADGILLRSKSLHELETPKHLLAAARAGAGVNNIPVERFSEQGIAVFNAPGANANAVAEMVLTAILLQIRNVPGSLKFTQDLFASEEDNFTSAIEKGKSKFQGRELQGMKLGIVGLGAIGVLLANKAVALGMKVLGYDPHISVDNAWRLSAEVEHLNSLEKLFEQSDAVSVHVPYMKATHHLLNENNLRYLSEKAFLLNFSRAEVVDDQAVLPLLDADKLSAYITDFPNPVLQEHPKVLCLPHLGASTGEAQQNASMQVLKTLDAFLKYGEVRDSVNLPELQPGPIPEEGCRLVIINRNTVGMIAQITDCIEEEEENIIEMNNRSRGDYALTVIDLAAEPKEGLLQRIQRIPNILSARYC